MYISVNKELFFQILLEFISNIEVGRVKRLEILSQSLEDYSNFHLFHIIFNGPWLTIAEDCKQLIKIQEDLNELDIF